MGSSFLLIRPYFLIQLRSERVRGPISLNSYRFGYVAKLIFFGTINETLQFVLDAVKLYYQTFKFIYSSSE